MSNDNTQPPLIITPNPAIAHDYRAEAARNNFLLRLKTHMQSAFIPRTLLYEQTHKDFEPLSPRPIVWSVSGGSIGGESFSKASDDEHDAAHTFLERGVLVRSFARSAMGGYRLCRIQHTEDVNWGVDQDGRFHMFRLAAPPVTQADEIPEMDETHAPAIQTVKARIDAANAYIDERPITLSNGLILRPVIQGHEAVLRYQRQKEAIQPL